MVAASAVNGFCKRSVWSAWNHWTMRRFLHLYFNHQSQSTVELPESMPIGAKVAVTLLPIEESQEDNVARNLRFQQVMDAIRAAINSNYTSPEISDQELNQLIRKARQSAKAW